MKVPRFRRSGDRLPYCGENPRAIAACMFLFLTAALLSSDVVQASVAPYHASSQPSLKCVAKPLTTNGTTSWAAPLDRVVTIRLPDASVRDALEQVARTAGLELSYSRELLPLERRVCLRVSLVPVGAVIEAMLEGSTLHPIVVSASQVVLAPARGAPVGQMSPTGSISRRASVLDRVVVTGTPDGAAQRGSPFALDVIDGATLARTNAQTLSAALELAVPGIWTWGSSAGSLSARFGSIRGSSSFGVTTPKIYLDGIEVANPLVVTSLDPTRVDRVEVIRGPQGAALYGADAISGVVNIITRHDGSATGSPTVQLSSRAGLTSSQYASGGTWLQDHGASVRAGSGSRTFGLGVNFNTVGEFVPGASEQHFLADADARVVRSRSIFTATSRFSSQRANPSSQVVFNDSATGQRVSQYTLGVTATSMPSVRWTNTLIAGADGYRLRGLSAGGLPPVIDGSDNSPALGQGEADRGSLRARTVGRFDLAEGRTFALTLGVEAALTGEVTQPISATGNQREDRSGGQESGGNATAPGSYTPQYRQLLLTSPQFATTWTNNVGMLAQGNLSLDESLYLTAGGRIERNTGATPNAQVAFLPLLGASYVVDGRGMLLKFRSAYGKGIRPLHSLARSASWMGRTAYGAATDYEPEEQVGTEVGVDLLFGKTFFLHATRFDQRASGLVQPITSISSNRVNGQPVRLLGYSFENLGAIDNRGWEFQGSGSVGRVRVAGSFTLASSEVARVALGYRGDLRVGDRMLDVPARTMSLTTTWFESRWNASATLARAENWIGYDRIAIAAALEPASALGEPEASESRPLRLRNYWRRYGNSTRLRANFSYNASSQFALEFGGDNLLNVQSGAPDNATLIAGRTITFGLRTNF